jgi:hypothetical protein
LQEKQQALLTEQREQQRLDLMMEIERLKALEAYQVGGQGQEGTWATGSNMLQGSLA